MIPISPQTKIATLIRQNKDAIEAIAALAKPLEKLKNPIMRKLMAGRVSIEEAAQMGGCSIADFARALHPLGFQMQDWQDEMNNSQTYPDPDWLINAPAESISHFDVRELLSSGNDPLRQIMQRYRELPLGNTMCIINSFVPVPLLKVLEGEGAKTHVKTINPQEYRSYFYKHGEGKQKINTDELRSIFMDEPEAFENICHRFPDEKLRKLDVTMLEMPMPMRKILETLPTLLPGEALYVYHKRIPVYLMEELSDKHYEIHITRLAEKDLRILIFPKSK
jgi:uncharacterized protein (DUF2249 family)